MNVAFDGYGENVLTFEAASGLAVGDLVKISANGTVAKCSKTEGEAFCGICVNVRDGLAGVQLKGYCRVKYTGSLALGFQSVGTTDGETVKVLSSGGVNVLVTDLDTSASVAGMIL